MYRIAPENLIPRTQNASMSVKILTLSLLKTIKSEFEHNITQQVYVSTKTWDAVELYKNNLIALVKETSIGLDPNQPALALSEKILQSVIQNPTLLGFDEVSTLLKKEVKQLFL